MKHLWQANALLFAGICGANVVAGKITEALMALALSLFCAHLAVRP